MKALWKNEVAEFHGEFVNFGPSWMYPTPLQDGGAPSSSDRGRTRCCAHRAVRRRMVPAAATRL